VESDPWGKLYKLVMGKPRKRTPILGIGIPGKLEHIIEGFFPTHQPKEVTTWPTEEDPPPPITIIELMQAARSFKASNAPEIDRIPNEILKEVVKLRPGLMLDIYNKCIT